MTDMKGISRRSFLTGSAVLGGAAALAGLAGCSPAPKDTSMAETGSATEEDWLGEAPALTEADCDNVVDADVVVIGSAVAGSLSAFGALENGAKVVMLERNKIFHYGGNQGSFLNSEFQKQSGKPTYDPKEIVYHIVGNTANRCDIRQWRVWADRSGELVDTLIEKVLTSAGIPFTCSPAPDEPELWLNRVFDINVVLGDPTKDNYKEFLSGMHAYLADNGADIRYNTKAEVLVQDEAGRVTGVIATAEDGSRTLFKAAKGVIVCTGSYAGNAAMVKKFQQEKVAKLLEEGNVYTMYMDAEDLSSAEPMDDGIGHRMMCWAGAEMEGGPHGFLGWPNGGHIGCPNLEVDQAGRRYMNEALFPVNQVQQVVSAASMPSGAFTWEISSTEDRLMPCFIGIDPNVLDAIAKSGTGVYQADTLEELAELIDVDPATFTATIERYNEMCEKGVDEDFMKSSEYLIPVKNPPFYAFNEKWVFVCSIAGVHTNDKFQVLNADHEVIPGLFAAGNTVGRRFGYAYESSGMGMSNSQAMVAGYVAGETAASS